MAKIFNPPSEVKVPPFDWNNISKYHKDCDQYKADLKKALEKYNPNGKNVGEVIKFPVADGYAEYMVANMKQFNWYISHLGMLGTIAMLIC